MYKAQALGNTWDALHEKHKIYHDLKAVEKVKEVEQLILEKTDGLKRLLDTMKKYIGTYGNLQPATNLYSSLNSLFNYGVSFVGIKTNQKHAEKAKEIIETALEKCKENFSVSIVYISDALRDLKVHVYDKLIEEGKANGTVGTAIKNTLLDYNVVTNETDLKLKFKY